MLLLPPARAQDAAKQADRWEFLESGFAVDVNGYRLEVSENPDADHVLQIRRGDLVLFESKEQGFSIHRPSFGADITGTGVPHVAIMGWSGGAHCCFTLHIVQLGETLRALPPLDLQDIDVPDLADVDGAPGLEIDSSDILSYYDGSFASSPWARVVLRFDGTRYVVAPDLMRRPPPADTEVSAAVARAHDHQDELNFLPEFVWGPLMRWIYQGNLGAACGFLNQLNVDVEDFDRRVDDFFATLERYTPRYESGINYPGLRAALLDLNGATAEGRLSCRR